MPECRRAQDPKGQATPSRRRNLLIEWKKMNEMKRAHTYADLSLHSQRRHPRPRFRWWPRLPGLRHPSGHCQVARTSSRICHSSARGRCRLSAIARHRPVGRGGTDQTATAAAAAAAPSANQSPRRLPTTKSTSTSTARTSSSRPSSPTTAHSSSPITAKWSPRSSVVKVPAPDTRSLTVKQFANHQPGLFNLISLALESITGNGMCLWLSLVCLAV